MIYFFSVPFWRHRCFLFGSPCFYSEKPLRSWQRNWLDCGPELPVFCCTPLKHCRSSESGTAQKIRFTVKPSVCMCVSLSGPFQNTDYIHVLWCKTSQVTFAVFMYTMLIVSKQFHINKQENHSAINVKSIMKINDLSVVKQLYSSQ